MFFSFFTFVQKIMHDFKMWIVLEKNKHTTEYHLSKMIFQLTRLSVPVTLQWNFNVMLFRHPGGAKK